jgi:hypothetical protein
MLELEVRFSTLARYFHDIVLLYGRLRDCLRTCTTEIPTVYDGDTHEIRFVRVGVPDTL